MVGEPVDGVAWQVSGKNSWVASNEYRKTRRKRYPEKLYLSVVDLSLGERFWLARPEELFSGDGEGFLDWGLPDLGLSESTTGNLITSCRMTGWVLPPVGFGERFCLWFSLRGVTRCWVLCGCDDRWGCCFGMMESSPGVRVGWTETWGADGIRLWK